MTSITIGFSASASFLQSLLHSQYLGTAVGISEGVDVGKLVVFDESVGIILDTSVVVVVVVVVVVIVSIVLAMGTNSRVDEGFWWV